MADKTGKEASIKFLEENKKKDGITTLDSGLQYKVLKEGRGMDHPTVGTPCLCHYKGTLIDGTKFDSSYDRGEPTQFAPNQVIRGWTEAMQLMVEGDKWEMYIPQNLAYGERGSPPKIPPEATLIFTMEIIKIKGKTNPKKIDFPEWTPEQLALWEEKDEAQCQKWRDAKEKEWEEGKLKDKHPTREGFDTWLAQQSLTARNKSLWKRTRRDYEAEAGGGGYSKASAPPALTKETARALLTKAIDTFKIPTNKEKLEGIIKECEAGGGDPAQAGMMKMMKLMPAIQEMLGSTMTEYGFGPNDLMQVTMQIQAFAPEDPSIAADIGKVMKAVQGDVKDLLDDGNLD
jgi:FKBP-type peptidyl-prolyl cis-trans isomerase FklB